MQIIFMQVLCTYPCSCANHVNTCIDIRKCCTYMPTYLLRTRDTCTRYGYALLTVFASILQIFVIVCITLVIGKVP